MKRLALILLALAATACGASSPTAPDRTKRLLRVEGVSVTILDSLPVQAIAQVTGNLGSVCASVDEIRVRRQDRVIEVTITTVPTAEVCILLYPPPVTVPVHLGYFGSGEYLVRVNGFETRFTV